MTIQSYHGCQLVQVVVVDVAEMADGGQVLGRVDSLQRRGLGRLVPCLKTGQTDRQTDRQQQQAEQSNVN